jgi:site-specific DNA-methyltransferase (adenine-specific)
MKPFFTDDTVSLYVGDCREILPKLGVTADLVLADPPYGETSLAWDRWPGGWLDIAAQRANSLWCFGSMRMFGERWREFGNAGWKLSQDIVWEKHHGSGMAADRFRRVHESATHWYRTRWAGIYHETPRTVYSGPDSRHGYTPATATSHMGATSAYRWNDDGTRLMKSVLAVRSMWRRGAIHPTEKPVDLLHPLIAYGCPPGGLVIDPFAGSGSTLDAARQSGRRAIGIEANEAYAEKAARRLEQLTLEPS